MARCLVRASLSLIPAGLLNDRLQSFQSIKVVIYCKLIIVELPL
ncbi:hypothetical protein VCHA52P454_70006 [Vibrio chagasii]|nr:hypothetical protein VCHA52P454_70006 [Vibrio chagasii]